MNDASPITILLVDDNIQLITSLIPPLRDIRGYRVLSAYDGIEALHVCTEQRPDCIIVDVMMPGLDGYQFVRALRGDPVLAEIPLIVLSALAQDPDLFQGLAAGADAYLIKPVRIETLFATIDAVLQVSSHERQIRYQQLAGETKDTQAHGDEHIGE